MRKSSSFAALIFIIIFGVGIALAYATYIATSNLGGLDRGPCIFCSPVYISFNQNCRSVGKGRSIAHNAAGKYGGFDCANHGYRTGES